MKRRKAAWRKALYAVRLYFCICPANASGSPYSAAVGMANDFKFDVFLSHNAKNKLVVYELIKRFLVEALTRRRENGTLSVSRRLCTRAS
jgi:hypothetical protein